MKVKMKCPRVTDLVSLCCGSGMACLGFPKSIPLLPFLPNSGQSWIPSLWSLHWKNLATCNWRCSVWKWEGPHLGWLGKGTSSRKVLLCTRGIIPWDPLQTCWSPPQAREVRRGESKACSFQKGIILKLSQLNLNLLYLPNCFNIQSGRLASHAQ